MRIHYMPSVNIQVRMPKSVVEELDGDIKRGIFTSRSDAIRTIVRLYELSKRKEFFDMLEKRAKEIENGDFIGIDGLE